MENKSWNHLSNNINIYVRILILLIILHFILKAHFLYYQKNKQDLMHWSNLFILFTYLTVFFVRN